MRHFLENGSIGRAKPMLFCALFAVALAGCAAEKEDKGLTKEDLLTDFPTTPAEVAEKVWSMNCEQLEGVEEVFAYIDTYGAFARPFIERSRLGQEDKATVLDILNANSDQRRDAAFFLDAVQLLKSC